MSLFPLQVDGSHRTPSRPPVSIEQIRAEGAERRVAVFTHHAPTIEGAGDAKFLGGPINRAFATELMGWAPPVNVWAFGHTHYNCDFVRDGVQVVSDQTRVRIWQGVRFLMLKKLSRYSVVTSV